MKIGNFFVLNMKKFFQKHKKPFIVTGAVLLVAIIGLVSFFVTGKKDTLPGICVFSPTPTSVSASVDPKIKEFGLKIDKLNILVPIIKDVDGSNKTAYEKALKGGVAHFKGTSLPGEKGNIFIFGHSSAETRGNYSKIFVSLNDLGKDDEIVVFYQGNEHKYTVSEKKIVEATEISVLAKGKKEILTLMTCWPIGTKEKRLIIQAKPS